MELSKKLIELFCKFIDKSESIDDIELRGNQITCWMKDGTSRHSIVVKKIADGLGGTKVINTIFFQDLSENITKEDYELIADKAKDRKVEFEEIEKQKELNRQKKLVDRLLDEL